MMDKTDLIPEAKLREACAKCTQHAKHARYFNEAPSGAKQYIALVFFETVFPDALTEEVSEQCFAETLQELNEDDLLYLIAHETDSRARDAFVERLAFLKEQSAQQRRRADKPTPPPEQPPAVRSAGHAAPPMGPDSAPRAADPVYQLPYDARRLDGEVAAWNRRWKMVCVSLVLIFVLASVYGLICCSIYKGWLRVRHCW